MCRQNRRLHDISGNNRIRKTPSPCKTVFRACCLSPISPKIKRDTVATYGIHFTYGIYFNFVCLVSFSWLDFVFVINFALSYEILLQTCSLS